MKYSDLIQFEPVNEVIKLVNANQSAKAKELVRTYVFSKSMKHSVQAIVVPNLDPAHVGEQLGIQIVGSYGTGKSHLMALISAVAEDAALLSDVRDPEVATMLTPIAGKYKVLRFEMGNNKSLNEVFFDQVSRYLGKLGIEWSLPPTSKLSWKDEIAAFMGEFEEKFPDKHMLVVVDEMLDYLKGRQPQELQNDLVMMRQIMEACDRTRFKFIFGVQELLYSAPEFQFQATILQKVSDRCRDLIITREDVAFVVKERLLRKDDAQKTQIREHLTRFVPMFEDMVNRLGEYVDLYPVHPNYLSQFEAIRHGKGQREILKVLSHKFMEMQNASVPADRPGLITYDSYWLDLDSNAAMKTIPDIRRVADAQHIIQQRIDSFYGQSKTKASQKPLASAIVNALSISILKDDLDRKNGATAKALRDDLCLTLPIAKNAADLLDFVENVARDVVKATSGQYVVQDAQSSEFHLRVEGGRNIDQDISDYADQQIKRSPGLADQAFFDLLQYMMGMNQNTYRQGFQIWEDSLEWKSKKAFRRGYIFFGNPGERSTTTPIQQYYLFFCPLFSPMAMTRKPDEVFFDFTDLDEEFRNAVYHFGASKALLNSAPSDQKSYFQTKIDEWRKRAQKSFEDQVSAKARVHYEQSNSLLKTKTPPNVSAQKDGWRTLFGKVATDLLGPHFDSTYAQYPAFPLLQSPLTPENYEGSIRSALNKIGNDRQPNREGEAILGGLGLWDGLGFDPNQSPFARWVVDELQKQGTGKVLNRSDLLEVLPQSQPPAWFTKPHRLDAELFVLVLSVLVYRGLIELTLENGTTLDAANLAGHLRTLKLVDLVQIRHVKHPKALPVLAIRRLFEKLNMPDLSQELDKQETVILLISRIDKLLEDTITTKQVVQQGIRCGQEKLINDVDSKSALDALETLREKLDRLKAINTPGKLKNLPDTAEQIEAAFAGTIWLPKVKRYQEAARKFDMFYSYLNMALQYVPSQDALYGEIQKGMAEACQAAISEDNAKQTQVEATLRDLQGRYAVWYVSQAEKYLLKAQDAHAKTALEQSDLRQWCDSLQEVVSNRKPFTDWLIKLSSLQRVPDLLTVESVIANPSHGFQPKEWTGRAVCRVSDLLNELEQIADDWSNSLLETLQDPSVKANLELLEAAQKKTIQLFTSNDLLRNRVNGTSLRDAMQVLSRGIERVEVKTAELRNVFHKPMTPEEASTALHKWIEQMCQGKERNKIRLVLGE